MSKKYEYDEKVYCDFHKKLIKMKQRRIEK